MLFYGMLGHIDSHFFDVYKINGFLADPAIRGFAVASYDKLWQVMTSYGKLAIRGIWEMI